MYGVGVRHLLSYNTTRTYSPIILNTEWPTLWRLIFIVFFATTGTIVNGFFVSSFFIENPLRKIGNVYLACVGLADMIITTGVMPAAAVVLISKVWEISSVCYALQLLTQASTYSYSLLFTMVAIENYIRLCRTRACYARFLSIHIGLVSFMIFVISFATSGVGVYRGMDYDYCTRQSYGNYTFRLITSLLLHGVPCVFTISFFVSTSFVVRARALRLIHYRRSKQYHRDYTFTNLNIGCYIFFLIAWLPYLLIVNKYPATADSNYYNCVWLGLSRSIVTSFLYSGLNSNFRRAFAHLFYYCCCKSSMNEQFNNRHRRTIDYKITSGDVHVHIMHHSVAMSPRRGAKTQAAASSDGARSQKVI